jgi:integrase
MARREFQNPSVLEREGAAGREWYIRYRVKVLQFDAGKPVIKRIEKWHHLGMCATMTKRQAERARDGIMRGVNQQVYTVQSQIPFSQVLKVFIENHVPGLAGPTQATYRQVIHAYIEPAFKDLRLCDVGTLQIEQLFRAMELRNLSRNTRLNTKGILKAIFGCARRWKYMDTPSPVKDASVGGGPRHVRECRIPSVEDVARLIAACDGDVPLLIETLVTTGMRISEAAGLVVADLDFARGLIHVNRRRCRGDVGQTKSEAGVRDLGMGSLAPALETHVLGKAPADPVFTHEGEPIVDNTLLANYLSPIMVDLGIKFPGFGWHTFRRLHLSLMNQRGLSIFDLRQQAGHADVRTTQRYIAGDVERRAQAVGAKPFLVKAEKKSA